VSERLFQSWHSFWDFQREVLRSHRFVRSAEAEAFLQAVRHTAQPRLKRINKGTILWRAQLGHDWREERQINDSVPCAFPPARMKPLADRAHEGRVNPKGIPCLYLCSTAETAMSEVRPWLGSYVSLAQFKIERDLALVDCSMSEKRIWFHLEEPAPEVKTETVWAHIDEAFSEPVTRSDDTGTYAPTQILAETFRSLGADGVVYRSSLGESGYNIAVFDLEVARLINCALHEVKSVKFEFKEADLPYFVKEV
jgi:RES domain-containing protein